MIRILKDIFNLLVGKQYCSIYNDGYTTMEALQQYSHIINNNLIISKTDIEGTITFVNDSFLKIFNITRDEVIGKNHSVIKCKITSEDEFNTMWDTIKGGETWKGMMSHKINGEILWFYTTIYPIFDKKENIIEFFSIRNDITELINLKNDVQNAQEEMILTLGSLIEGKDPELKQHVYRVAEYSYIIAKEMRLPENACRNIKIASPIHDAGKVSIPDEVLHKPGKLTLEEFEIMKRHAESGYEFFKDSKLELLKIAAVVAHQHHEKWDGSGYPQGLKGEDISIYGRIVAFADVFDALSMKRVYKETWSLPKIEKFLLDNSGTHFDPKLVEIYFKNKDKFLEIRDKFDS